MQTQPRHEHLSTWLVCCQLDVVGDDPRSSDAGHSTDTLEKLTNCPLQPMGVAVGESAAAADAELEHLPGDEGPMVVPL
jgi:hypothetical protein